jgi:hypothetical protein
MYIGTPSVTMSVPQRRNPACAVSTMHSDRHTTRRRSAGGVVALVDEARHLRRHKGVVARVDETDQLEVHEVVVGAFGGPVNKLERERQNIVQSRATTTCATRRAGLRPLFHMNGRRKWDGGGDDVMAQW